MKKRSELNEILSLIGAISIATAISLAVWFVGMVFYVGYDMAVEILLSSLLN